MLLNPETSAASLTPTGTDRQKKKVERSYVTAALVAFFFPVTLVLVLVEQ